MDFFQSKHVSCKPITNLKSLLTWPGNTQPPNYKTIKLVTQKKNRNQRQLIVCHDMRNNYLADRYFQGSKNHDEYTFYHWNIIDMFIYFSHHFITIPPESWINAAHENNTRILGTIITEWTDGYLICQELLKDQSTVEKYVEKLVQLTLHYNFDGWLINIENKIDNTGNLIYFVKELTRRLKAINEELYKVIWYDSVIETGELKWQNELNKLNECFFNVCDGIFVNYSWKFENLANCTAYADRLQDIFIGVDVFGRNCYGGGGFSSDLAVEKIKEYDLSCAIFATGWVIECNQASDFFLNNEKFWRLLESATVCRSISSLPILSTFMHSRAENFFLPCESVSISKTSWCNLNLQSLMPILKDTSSMKWCFEDAFYGGSCVEFDKKASVNRLFDLSVDINPGCCLRVEYAIKIESSMMTDYVEALKICLGYETEDSSFGIICSGNVILPVSNEFEIINRNSYVNESGWFFIAYDVLVKEFLSLKELTVVKSELPGSDYTVKLGLIKIFVPNKSVDKRLNDFIPKISYRKNKVFRLSNEIYFCAELYWEKFSPHAKYYNIFIQEKLKIASKDEKVEDNSGKSSNKMCYIGSTKFEEFRLCFKVNKDIISYNEQETNEDKNNSKYAFNVFIQEFDEHLECLVSGFKSASMSIPLMNFNLNNEENLEFIGEIIYDFEFF